MRRRYDTHSRRRTAPAEPIGHLWNGEKLVGDFGSGAGATWSKGAKTRRISSSSISIVSFNVADPAAGEVGEGEEPIYTILRLTLPPGAWIGVVVDPGESARPLVLPEWVDLYQEHPRSDTVISDDSIGAPRVAHEMMRRAEARVGRDIGDYWGGEKDLNQLVARAFAEEELWPMRPGTSVTWCERYLRAWRRDRLERMGGERR